MIDNRIQQYINSDKIVLFMKGTKEMPMCGFSGRVIYILDQLGINFTVVDVLQDPEIREGIKVFSNWPTIPQLYLNGEFIGGCDIVTQLHSEGKLEKILK